MTATNLTPRTEHVSIGARLDAVLVHDGHTTRAAKIHRLVDCGISRSTAARALDDEHKRGRPSCDVQVKLALGLDVSLTWLVLGRLDLFPGMSARWAEVAGERERLAIVDGYERLPAALKPKFRRLMILVLNKSRKAANLMTMVERGQMTVEQALARV